MGDFKFWLHHAGVSVPDLEASIAWYRDVLGFEVEKRFDLPKIPTDVAMLRNGDLRIELFQPEAGAALPHDRRDPQIDVKTHGNKHVAFIIEDIGALFAEFERRGVDIVWLQQTPTGSRGFIRDNAGNPIEFVEHPEPAGLAASL
jgi:methylmalonyl-CoA/ethylmalonyl-CoA epimerase